MSKVATRLQVSARLRLFDAATRRQAERQSRGKLRPVKARGWARDELYDRDARAR